MWLILTVIVFFLQGTEGQRSPPGRYQEVPSDPGDEVSSRIVVFVAPTSSTLSTTTTASPPLETSTPRPTNGSDPEPQGDEEVILPGNKILTNYMAFLVLF